MATDISWKMLDWNIIIKYINTIVVSAIACRVQHSSVLPVLSASNLML
jgi:hypothetical protein